MDGNTRRMIQNIKVYNMWIPLLQSSSLEPIACHKSTLSNHLVGWMLHPPPSMAALYNSEQQQTKKCPVFVDSVSVDKASQLMVDVSSLSGWALTSRSWVYCCGTCSLTASKREEYVFNWCCKTSTCLCTCWFLCCACSAVVFQNRISYHICVWVRKWEWERGKVAFTVATITK